MAEEKHSEEGGHGGGGHGGGGHSAGAHEEHEGAPEWLISFADNVALLMGFFAILLAMNMKDPTTGGIGGREKMGGAPLPQDRLDFVIAMRAEFNNPVDLHSDNPKEAALRERIRQRMAEAAGASRQPEERGESKESQSIVPTNLSSLGGSVPFEDDSDLLTDRGRQTVEQIAAKLVGQRWMIEVRGHASPSETRRSPEVAVDLSYRRARAVARVLVAHGLTWSQIRMSQAGDSERKVDRSYDERDRGNQRVEVIPTNDPAPDPLHMPMGIWEPR